MKVCLFILIIFIAGITMFTISIDSAPSVVKAQSICSDIGGCSEAGMRSYLEDQGSPLAEHVAYLIEAGRRHNVDPRFLIAIAGAESTFGTRLCADYNAWNYFFESTGCAGSDYSSWEEAIEEAAGFIHRYMTDRGYDTLSEFVYVDDPDSNGTCPELCYCTESCEDWITNVTQILEDLHVDPSNEGFPFPSCLAYVTLYEDVCFNNPRGIFKENSYASYNPAVIGLSSVYLPPGWEVIAYKDNTWGNDNKPNGPWKLYTESDDNFTDDIFSDGKTVVNDNVVLVYIAYGCILPPETGSWEAVSVASASALNDCSPPPPTSDSQPSSGDTISYVSISAGAFTVGSSPADIQQTLIECSETQGNCKVEWFNEPRSTVFVNDFEITKYEITNAQYEECVEAGVCQGARRIISIDNDPPYKKVYFTNDYPVVGVSWYDANTFCQWIGGRLPTEVEWEKAARGTTDGRRYPWGNTFNPTDDPKKANLKSGGPSPVGHYSPQGDSPYGVADMAGNVFEWTATQAGDNYVIRGGSWFNYYFRGRVTDRGLQREPTFANYDVGFRCVRSAVPSPVPTPAPQIVYTGQDYNVWIIHPDGTNAHSLNTGDSCCPIWSFDGTKIAYRGISSDRGSHDIYVMNADGTNKTRLTTQAGWDWAPSWSPDGKHIVFITNRHGKGEVYVMNADGSNQTNISNHPAAEWDAVWSPLGDRISFISDRDGDYEIYSMRPDGSDVRQLTFNTATDWRMGWSPDGQKIVFSSDQDGDHEIFLMNADGSERKQLTFNRYDDQYPDFSSDGQRIVFQSNRTGRNELFTMSIDGTGQTRLTVSGGGVPRWLPIPAAVPSPVPTPAPQIVFTADPMEIDIGECTRLSWEVDNVREVYLGDDGVVGHSDKRVCPATTTTYRLRVLRQDGGQEDRQVTITVRDGLSYCQGDKSYDCTISATQAWQKTPLLLQSGDTFTISSIGGTWTVDRDHFPFVGPDGYSSEIDRQICCHDQCKTDFSQPYAKLLARIGNGPHFVAGSGGTFTADRDGFLALRINDEVACQDNDAGSVTMRLERR